MPKIAIWAGAVLWSVFVFMLTFYTSFPSEAAASRVSDVVRTASGGDTVVRMDGVRPWWVGFAAENVMVLKPDEATGEDVPFLYVDELGANVGFWGLLARDARLTAYLEIDGGTADVQTDVAWTDEQVEVSALSVDAEGLALTDVLAAVMTLGLGTEAPALDAEGTLDLEVDLDLETGADKPDGKIVLSSDNIYLAKINMPSVGMVDQDVGLTLETLNLRLQADGDGQVEVVEGELRSSLADVDISGDVDLVNPMSRSRLDLEVLLQLGDWTGSPLEPLRGIAESALKSALWGDGRYHYTVATSVDRFSASAFRPERERSRSSRAPASSSGEADRPSSSTSRSSLSDRLSTRTPPTTRTSTSAVRAGGPTDDELEDDEDFEDEEDLEDEEGEDEDEQGDEDEAGDEAFEDLDQDY